MVEMKTGYKILIGKSKSKKRVERSRDRSEDVTEVDLKPVGCDGE
jgi:hypothetical protein